MLKVRYEYRCDFCGWEGEAQEYDLFPSTLVPAPSSYPIRPIGNAHACADCLQAGSNAAWEAAAERKKVNSAP